MFTFCDVLNEAKQKTKNVRSVMAIDLKTKQL